MNAHFKDNSSFDSLSKMQSVGKMNNLSAHFLCLNSTYEHQDNVGPFCNMTWDSVSCWPTTLGGKTAVIACPANFRGIDPTKNATKFCHFNGTWESKANYNNCFIDEPTVPHQGFLGKELETDYATIIIYNLGFSVSTIALAIALFIFIYFRSLRCTRNIIHSHLIVTFILRNLVWITMRHSLITIANNQHTWACKLLVAIFNYAQTTNFFWMLVEGLYLHIIIVWTYSADNIKKWIFIIIGWFLPGIIILVWVIVRVQYESSYPNETKNILIICWLPSMHDSPKVMVDYIYIAPILVVLAINVVFLSTIIWMLVTKLRASNSLETRQFRKTVKASILLLPLLGITYVIFIWSPSTQPILIEAHRFINAFLQSFQGFFVALFYCFLNGEVKTVIKKKIARFRDNRFLSTRYTRTSVGWANDVSIRKESVALANGKLAVGSNGSQCTETTSMLRIPENCDAKEIVL